MVAFVLLAIAFIALGVWGAWGIFNYYMPTVAVARDFSLGIVTISLLAGCAAFFSPCAFGMLPAYFGFYALASPEGGRAGTAESAVKLGLWAALGIAVPGVVLAALVLNLGPRWAAGLRLITVDPSEVMRVVRIILGLALVVLGALQLRGKTVGSAQIAGAISRLPLWRARPRSQALAFFLYGVGYLVASVPCTANVMVAPVLYSFAAGGVAGVAGTILLIVLTMGVLMILTSLLFAFARDSVVLKARLLTRDIQRASGVLLIAMGLVIIYFTVDTRTFFLTFWKFRPAGVQW